MAKSYVHAQKMVGADKISNKFATEEDWNVVYEKLGRPKNSDGYKLDAKGVDEAGLKVCNTSSQMGLLPKQANDMVQWYQSKIEASTKEADSIAENARSNAVTELKEYGQAYDQKLAAASAFAKKYVDTSVLDSALADGTKLGDHPAIIKAFVNIAGKMGEDQFVNPSGPSYLTPKEIDKQIASLTSDPKSAYWDKNHPSHAEAVKEVLELREKKTIE